MRIGVRIVLGAVALLNAVETAEGAPQAVSGLRKLGVEHAHAWGLIVAVFLTVVLGLLAIGPKRLHEWREQLRGNPHSVESKSSVAPSEEPKQLVIATVRDAALAKVAKWIKRGKDLEAGFPALPTPKEIDSWPEEDKRERMVGHIKILEFLEREEYWAIDEWHQKVVEELQALGGGALGLYSASEKPIRGMGAVSKNRAFLRERIEELEAIRVRLQPERPEPRRPSALAKAAAAPPEPERPTIEPKAASQHLVEATELMEHGPAFVDEAWNLTLRTKRKIGFPVLGDTFVTGFREWNNRVVDLGDKTLSVKERAQVKTLPAGMGAIASLALSAETVEEIVNDNLRWLRTVKRRCDG